jgi:hypothetical protein
MSFADKLDFKPSKKNRTDLLQGEIIELEKDLEEIQDKFIEVYRLNSMN